MRDIRPHPAEEKRWKGIVSVLLPLVLLSLGYLFAPLLLPWVPDRFFPAPAYLLDTAAFVLPLLAFVFVLLMRGRTARRLQLTLPVIVVGMVLLSMPLFLRHPLGSSDVFAYGYFGHLITVDGINPYTVRADAAVTGQYLALTRSEHAFSTNYGPLWTSLEAFIAWVARDAVGWTTTLYRMLALGAFAGIVAVVYQLRAGRPEQTWGTLLVAWNPFLLFEVASNAHNDVVMTLLLMLAVFAYCRRHDTLVLPLLTVAALVKFVPALLLPVALFALWRRPAPLQQRVRTILVGTGVSLLLTVISFVPYWEGLSTFRAVVLLGQSFALPFFHPLQLGSWLLQLIGSSAAFAESAVRISGAALFVLLYGVVLHRVWTLRLAMTQAVIVVLLGFLTTVMLYFQPWYMLWVIPLLPLMSWKRRDVLFYGLTLLGAIAYPLY